jgi:uncharacterized membrane protein YhhN
VNQFFNVFSVYVLCSIIHCIGLLTPNRRISKLTKPLLMPLLLVYYLLSAKDPDVLIIAALTAGFLGDVFLIGKKGMFFVLGLSSFFIGQLLYISVFLNIIKLTSMHVWLVLPALVFFAYGNLIYLRLKPFIKSIRVVLIPYIIVLLSMGLFAFIYYVEAQSAAGAIVFAGALSFIASDSLLSFDMFVKAQKWRTIAVMATYTLAQGLLVSGLL